MRGVAMKKKIIQYKVKAYSKLSKRERLRRQGCSNFGKRPLGREKIAFDRSIDRLIRFASCRHRQPLGNPCKDFDESSKGKCKRDGHVCELLTKKGERYLVEYEEVLKRIVCFCGTFGKS